MNLCILGPGHEKRFRSTKSQADYLGLMDVNSCRIFCRKHHTIVMFTFQMLQGNAELNLLSTLSIIGGY